MVRENLEKDTVLAGMRRNGIFAWRPDKELGKLVKAETLSWCKKAGTDTLQFKEGSHRMRDCWFENRYNWLDADGRPKKEDWTRSHMVTTENEKGRARADETVCRKYS